MMSHFSIHGVACGTMLLITAAPAVQSQEPHSASQTSVVQRFAPDSGPAPTGVTRELVCRGKPGIDLRVHRASVPDRPDHVTMVLRYERLKEVYSLVQRGMGNFDGGRSLQFIPGSCTWGGGFPGIPLEPLVVYFDLPRDAQAHARPGQRDTTAGAAVSYPDVVSVPRYLSDSSRYWIFYVDDASNVSISFRARELAAPAPAGHVAGSLRDAAPGSATLSSARVLADSERATVVGASNTAGGAAGTLQGSGAGAPTAASTKVLRDTAIMQSPSTRVPAPSNGVSGPLRDGGTSAARVGAGAPAPVSTGGTGVRPPAPAPAPSAGNGVTRPRSAPGNDTLLSARAITAGSRPGDARTSRTLLPDVRIWGVATAPGPQGVQLVFNTDRKHAGFTGRRGILVQFSQRRPPWDSAGRRWAYPPGWNTPWAAEITTPEHGGYMAEPLGRLELRQRYYYLITVESNDASLPPRQMIGSFVASSSPFAKAPPAPGPDPESNEVFGDALRGDATDAAGALRDQPAGATTAAGTTVRLPMAGASTGAGISRTRLPPDVRISGIETRPGNNGVKLWFETDRVWVRGTSRGVRVQFSTRQPRWENGLLVSPGVPSDAREVTSGRFEAEPHWTLEAGKRHYYLITVQSNDATLRPRQATGSFLPSFGP